MDTPDKLSACRIRSQSSIFLTTISTIIAYIADQFFGFIISTQQKALMSDCGGKRHKVRLQKNILLTFNFISKRLPLTIPDNTVFGFM